MLVLAACNEEAELAYDSSKNNKSDMTGEEVYSKALKATKDLESVEASIKVKQTVSSVKDDTVLSETDSDSDVQMTMDPIAVHVKAKTSENYDDITGDLPETDREMYMVDNGIYTYNDYSGNDGDWLKEENASVDVAEERIDQQPDPRDQLKIFQDYVDYLSFDQNADAYILKLDMKENDEEFNDFVKEMIEDNMSEEFLGQMGEVGQEALENMDINNMSLKVSVDKETFDIKTYDANMDMTMESNGEKNNIVQTMTSNYSNYNNVDPIEVPEDVKDKAFGQ